MSVSAILSGTFYGQRYPFGVKKEADICTPLRVGD